MDPVGFIMQNLGLAHSFGIHNKNDIQGAIIPLSGNNGSGIKLQVVMRF